MRGILFNEQGCGINTVQHQYQVRYLSGGRAEQNPEDWAEALYSILKEQSAYAKEQGFSIAAVSLTAQRSSVIPVDRNGIPLRPAIMWLDKRNAPICDELKPHEEQIFYASGARLNTVFSGGRMAWIKRNEPDIYNAAYKLMTIADYLAWLVTGEFKTDHTYGSRSMLMNIRARCWDSELLRLFELDEEKLCELISPGSVMGFSSRQAEELTGLPEGTPFISAGGDQQCAALGLGVVNDGDMEITAGTGAFLLASLGGVPDDISPDVICGAHAIPGKYVLETSMLTCASLFDWYHDQFYTESGSSYEKINGDIAESPAGAGGCIVLPYFQGRGSPDWNSKATGSFLNLTLNTKKSDMARAVLESIALEAANNLEFLEHYVGKTGAVYVSGGLTHSDEFNRIQASAYDRTVLKSSNAEQTALGAWVSAATVMGLFSSYEAALQCAKQADRVSTYLPNEEWAELYAKKRDEMNRIYRILYCDKE